MNVDWIFSLHSPSRFPTKLGQIAVGVMYFFSRTEKKRKKESLSLFKFCSFFQHVWPGVHSLNICGSSSLPNQPGNYGCDDCLGSRVIEWLHSLHITRYRSISVRLVADLVFSMGSSVTRSTFHTKVSSFESPEAMAGSSVICSCSASVKPHTWPILHIFGPPPKNNGCRRPHITLDENPRQKMF